MNSNREYSNANRPEMNSNREYSNPNRPDPNFPKRNDPNFSRNSPHLTRNEPRIEPNRNEPIFSDPTSRGNKPVVLHDRTGLKKTDTEKILQ